MQKAMELLAKGIEVTKNGEIAVTNGLVLKF